MKDIIDNENHYQLYPSKTSMVLILEKVEITLTLEIEYVRSVS